MAKSNSSAASKEKNAYVEANGEGNRQREASSKNGNEGYDFGEYAAFVDHARTWVEENQVAAMLSGFGFGVFIGVLLRR